MTKLREYIDAVYEAAQALAEVYERPSAGSDEPGGTETGPDDESAPEIPPSAGESQRLVPAQMRMHDGTGFAYQVTGPEHEPWLMMLSAGRMRKHREDYPDDKYHLLYREL